MRAKILSTHNKHRLSGAPSGVVFGGLEDFRRHEKVWVVLDPNNSYSRFFCLKNQAKCIRNDVSHLDLGWPVRMRGPARRELHCGCAALWFVGLRFAIFGRR